MSDAIRDNISPEYVAYRISQVLETIQEVSEKQVNLLLAVRNINGVLHELKELEQRVDPADFRYLTGISSECDDLPLGKERQYWAPDSLQEKDLDAANYESQVRDRVLQVFVRIAAALK